MTMEFVSSEGLTRGNRRTERLLRFDPTERPLSVQIYGADAERMAIAAARVEEMRVDVCDINMGCPANKVLKGCAGAGLMRDLGKARAIVAACVKALPTTPLTVKFRLGINDETENYLELGPHLRGRGRRRRRAPRADGEADVHGPRRLVQDRAPQGSRLDSRRRERRRLLGGRRPRDVPRDGLRRRDVRPRDDEEPVDLQAGRRAPRGPAVARGDARGAPRRHPRALPPHPARPGRPAEGDDVEAPHVHGAGTRTASRTEPICAAASRRSSRRRRSSTPSSTSSRRTPRESRPEGSRAAA